MAQVLRFCKFSQNILKCAQPNRFVRQPASAACLIASQKWDILVNLKRYAFVDLLFWNIFTSVSSPLLSYSRAYIYIYTQSQTNRYANMNWSWFRLFYTNSGFATRNAASKEIQAKADVEKIRQEVNFVGRISRAKADIIIGSIEKDKELTSADILFAFKCCGEIETTAGSSEWWHLDCIHALFSSFRKSSGGRNAIGANKYGTWPLAHLGVVSGAVGRSLFQCFAHGLCWKWAVILGEWCMDGDVADWSDTGQVGLDV